MARVVIDIPDEDFSLLCEAFGEVELKSTLNLRLQSAVAHGTPVSTEGDLISRREAEKLGATCLARRNENGQLEAIISLEYAPTVEEIEKPFITKCRNTAIEKNLPLYFVYYEETGIFEVYITASKELFEKRHCSKHLSNYEFEDIAIRYLDDYSNWKGGAE